MIIIIGKEVGVISGNHHHHYHHHPYHHHHHHHCHCHHHHHHQMADEEKFERTIAILGRLLRDDLQLQVGEILFKLRAKKVKIDDFDLFKKTLMAEHSSMQALYHMLVMMTPSPRAPPEVQVHVLTYKLHNYIPLTHFITQADPTLIKVQVKLCQLIYRYLSNARSNSVSFLTPSRKERTIIGL